ncbi:MAG: hypothetical protein ACKV19_12420 [Verrucomicrobiales bacterium]
MGESVDIETRDLGPQPLDGLMRARGMENHVLVEASSAALTHKQVQRARRGRRLTSHMQKKVAEAWARASGTAEGVEGLFTYRGH